MSKKKPGLGLFRNNPVTRMKFQDVSRKAKGVMDKLAGVGAAFNKMPKNPTPVNLLAFGVVGLSSLLTETSPDPSADPKFKRFWLFEFQELIGRVLSNHPSTKSLGSGEKQVLVTKLWNETVVLTGTKNDRSFFFLDREEDDQEEKVIQEIGRLIWDRYGSRVELMSSGRWSSTVRSWDIGDKTYSSEQTTALLERIKLFLDAGHTRSIILHGSPGTGKSEMSRTISKSLPGMTLFINASEFKDLRSNNLSSCLELLHPDIVIIDDLDCVYDVKSLLSAIDRIHRTTKLFIVTANDLASFDAAAVRAGRFDEIEEVERVIMPKDMIPGLDESVYEDLNDWPVSFVEELGRRIKVLGDDCLEKELERLKVREEANVVNRKRGAESPSEEAAKEDSDE